MHYTGPEVRVPHRLHCEKSPAEVVLPSPAEEVEPATGPSSTQSSQSWLFALE